MLTLALERPDEAAGPAKLVALEGLTGWQRDLRSSGCFVWCDALVRLIVDEGEQIVSKFIPAIVYPDEKDRPFLEAAVYANAVLLTNNLRDFPFLGVTVIAPEEFLGWCAEAGI